MTLSANVDDQETTAAELIERATAMAPELISRQQDHAEDTRRACRSRLGGAAR